MSELLRDPFGRVWEYPNFFLCLNATDVFKHIQKCQDLQIWWIIYGPFYQGVTINGRNVHGIEGSHHFYKRITATLEPSDESSDEDEDEEEEEEEEMSDEDDEMTHETSNEESSHDSDDMSYEPYTDDSSYTEDSSDDDDQDIIDLTNEEPEVIELTQDDD